MIRPTPERPMNAWGIYEARKAALPKTLTPAEYEAALKRIAQELGL